MKFRDLQIGQTFDFINDANPMLNSFYHTCRKVSARKYSWKAPAYLTAADFTTVTASVGSINVEVFHVAA